jgi:hypothetical protein
MGRSHVCISSYRHTLLFNSKSHIVRTYCSFVIVRARVKLYVHVLVFLIGD